MEQKNLGGLIWSVAELLRGDFKQSEYGLVILPFTVLRRFECVLEPPRDAVLTKHAEIAELGINSYLVLPEVSGQQFYNTSRYQLNNLGVADTLAKLEDYINNFSANARAVFEQFKFSNKLLYKVAHC
ncbi:type I restriction-modification system subunit M N-terminal domain-containing protein [Candidatus Endoriftia persephonae]|jgi:type I restriction enzyme M protein|uniref:Type I restriction-modification system, DNA-methyltransferase subunit M n=2 Tax=Gammaproteobacteria TaxID=1236 RepID=G2FC71_9GAMM|nr:type I restriction-modification system subunit M N-terminal domain-containing protein [Candidatus Endoriftia persephone]EGW55645.1 type I restriction-modification system, DNA-methyltransferase subunit M [endosymbiont of Tevnia jerichonana (vent Tica)]USF86788.1 type I restriction-modification system subunit M N-terminal domain-containing protein [Candidatus Endoriftia persephone]